MKKITTKTLLAAIITLMLSITPALADEIENCQYNNIPLNGKVKIVENFPDVKVKIVEHFPDIKVKKVDHFPDNCGEWEFVENFPDFTIQFVEHFPDFTVKFVENFPGTD